MFGISRGPDQRPPEVKAAAVEAPAETDSLLNRDFHVRQCPAHVIVEYALIFDPNSLIELSAEGPNVASILRWARHTSQEACLANLLPPLLVCRLSPPWFRHSAHGHDATTDEPYETLIGDNYLQVQPEQLWVFHQQTGEVVQKLSGSSAASEADNQLNLKLRQTPLLLQVSAASMSQIEVAVDDEPATSVVISSGTKTFAAKHKIVLTLEYPRSLSDINIKLNGKPYTPNWTKDATQIGSYESIRSATAVITAP